MAAFVLTLLVVLFLAALAACSGNEPAALEMTPISPDSATAPSVSTATPIDDVEESVPLFLSALAPHRTKLSICVDGAGGVSVSDADSELVREGLDSVTSNLGEEGYLRYLVEANIVAGCPEPTLPLGTPINSVNETRPYQKDVRVASEHLVFVYVLPQDVYAATFGEIEYFRAGAEVCCMTGNNGLVTSAVYVTRAITDGKLGEVLMRAMGFDFYCAPGDVCPTRLPS